jgi:iron(III) transport system ATP-binding protein
VIAARLLGRSSWVHLCLGQHPGPGATDHDHDQRHVHARVPGRYLPPEGAILDIDLDADQVFVFPVGAPT